MFPRLESFFYPNVEIRSNPNYDSDQPSNPEISLSGHLIFSSQRIFMADIHVAIEDAQEKNLPYDLDIQVYGNFASDEDLKVNPGQQEFMPIENLRAVRATAGGLLIGGLREFITTITARQPWGPYFIPTMKVSELRFDVHFTDELATKSVSKKKVAPKKLVTSKQSKGKNKKLRT
jgi:hypothetical protein